MGNIKRMTIKEHASRLVEIKDISEKIFKPMVDEIKSMSEGGTGGPYPNGRSVRDVFYSDDDHYTDQYFKDLLKEIEEQCQTMK